MMRHVLFAASLLICAQALPANAQQPWQLASMMPVTGSSAGYSQEFKLGFEIAMDEIKAAGGIKGRPVNLAILDTQSSPGQVATLIRQACSDALAVLGPALSNEAQVSFPVAVGAKCPSIGIAVAVAGLTAKNRPWAFSMLTPAPVVVPLAMEVVLAKTKPTRAVVFIEKQDVAANSWGELSAEALTKANIKTELVTVSSLDTDFGAAVTRAAASNPDFVLISALERASVGTLRELRKAKLPVRIMLTQGSYNAAVGALPPEILDGIYRFSPSDPSTSDDPKAKEFVRIYKSKSDGRAPSYVGALTYDLLMVTKDILARGDFKGDAANRDADRQKFIDALSAVKDFEGIGGKMSMSPEGFMVSYPMVLVYRAGNWDLVKAN